jgi:SAM-dependent methyltransferase
MPACVDCVRFDPEEARCTVDSWSPIRACIVTLLEQHLSQLRDLRVCEIGCGPWAFAKDIVEANGCEWFGIDPAEYGSDGRKTIRTHDGTVAEIPLPDDSVDYVLAVQSLEHWHQYQTRFQWGFREMHRVLRPGGTMMMNVPIHLHGHRMFVKGDILRIKSLWHDNLWTDVELEEWRREFAPLEPYRPWQKYGTNIRQIPNHGTASSWVLNVVAKKHDAGSPAASGPGLVRRASDALIDVPARTVWSPWNRVQLWVRRMSRNVPGFRLVRDLIKGDPGQDG